MELYQELRIGYSIFIVLLFYKYYLVILNELTRKVKQFLGFVYILVIRA